MLGDHITRTAPGQGLQYKSPLAGSAGTNACTAIRETSRSEIYGMLARLSENLEGLVKHSASKLAPISNLEGIDGGSEKPVPIRPIPDMFQEYRTMIQNCLDKTEAMFDIVNHVDI